VVTLSLLNPDNCGSHRRSHEWQKQESDTVTAYSSISSLQRLEVSNLAEEIIHISGV